MPAHLPEAPGRGDAEERLEIQEGSKPFVRNQLLLAADIAEKRERMRARPLVLGICPSTYCNYDCIMCVHGRTPRRTLPDTIWDEVDELLPTLRSLTLFGGEPLADPGVIRFIEGFDNRRTPDAAAADPGAAAVVAHMQARAELRGLPLIIIEAPDGVRRRPAPVGDPPQVARMKGFDLWRFEGAAKQIQQDLQARYAQARGR